MGETVNVGERRALLVDGANPEAGATITASRDGVVQIDAPDADGQVVVTALAAFDGLDISVTEGGRSGTDAGIVVVASPLTVTLGDPLP